ncbi:MAG: efflux RND transporter permease subunit [Planctomycetes bacterium]|nr:efflux RND transporter permease subunit [Planctomycetota bacterium]
MLNAIIRFSLRHPLLVIALSLVVLGYGGYELYHLPIDVFPDLNRPRVTVMTEAPGMAPEEVETLITFPLESVLNGATGVQAVRSSSGVGLSVIYVEFGWNMDIYVARQVVAEKLALAADRLPEGIRPQLAPISSIMGQIMLVGMQSVAPTLVVGDDHAPAGGENGPQGPALPTSPMELRTLADWVVRQRLLTIPGVAQVVTMGGGRKQFQVLVNPDSLLTYGVTLHEVEQAISASNANSTGGYLNMGPNEYLVRSIGRLKTIGELEDVVVKANPERPVLLRQVARVVEAAQVKRGESAVDGSPAVILTISKQPGADTRRLTDDITKALADLKASLPGDVRINPEVYQQRVFIDLGIRNVIEALRDGGILVVVILFLFLLNFRATFITLTAIPLSIVVTGLVFKLFGMSINTMTLGGLAVAIGELVDDAIVGVENVFRRLRENRHSPNSRPALQVVFQASAEVRNPIVFSTLIIILVFIPLFALSGMEGRLFTPLGVAYIVSILASLLVSLTVTPVLAYLMLPQAKVIHAEEDSLLLRKLKRLAGNVIRFGMRHPQPILAGMAALVLIGIVTVAGLGRDFLPPFNEGSAQVNVLLPPGTSLDTSNRIAAMVDERLRKVPGVQSFGRRTGRAELDEHAEGVNTSEIIVSFNPGAPGRTREQILDNIRDELSEIPGIVMAVEQPLQHLISHMLSGVKAQIGIKLYGDNLDVLRKKAAEMKTAIQGVPGVKDLLVEQQIDIPQLQIKLRRDQLANYGMHSQYVNEFVETAMNGKTVSEVLIGQQTFDLVVRLDDPYREDLERLKRLSLDVPGGGRIPLDAVADVIRSGGPNTINRENVRRRIIVQCNVGGRDLGSVVADIQRRLEPIQKTLPTGYFIEYGGQFESQRSATRLIGLLSLISLAGMFLVLYTLFRSVTLALQVLVCLPTAFVGAVAALVLTHQSLTVASLVGFISLGGIASRNGILLMAHYLHLMKYEGESFSAEMIERSGRERLAPVLMTALTAGIGLVPLVLAAGEPGKEILYPVATVILGGLITSTALEFLVRPAIFYRFGRRAAERYVKEDEAEIALEESVPVPALAAH